MSQPTRETLLIAAHTRLVAAQRLLEDCARLAALLKQEYEELCGLISQLCPQCGETFPVTPKARAKSIYCSTKCRMAAHRKGVRAAGKDGDAAH